MKLKCDCSERYPAHINSKKFFEELKDFFESQTTANIFKELKPNTPHYSWKNGDKKVDWYATKWYKCNVCGCLWEFDYPDFPKQGFVRKFPDGISKPEKVIIDGKVIEESDS